MNTIDKLESLSIRDLRCLETLAQTRHFGRAAQELSIAQPSLSASIQKIESVLGQKLFERTSRKVEIAPDAAPILECASRALGELSRMASHAQRGRKILSGRFTLGVIPTVAPYYLPHVLTPILAQFPACELVLREELTHDLLSSLRRGHIDAALLSLPLGERDLVEWPLFQEELFLAAPKNHKLCRKREISVCDIKPDEMILLEHGHCLRAATLAVCSSDGRGCIHATSLETLRFMVRAQIGAAMMPALAVRGREDAEIEYLPFQNPAPSRTLGLVALKNSARSEDARVLAEFLAEIEISI